MSGPQEASHHVGHLNDAINEDYPSLSRENLTKVTGCCLLAPFVRMFLLWLCIAPPAFLAFQMMNGSDSWIAALIGVAIFVFGSAGMFAIVSSLVPMALPSTGQLQKNGQALELVQEARRRRRAGHLSGPLPFDGEVSDEELDTTIQGLREQIGPWPKASIDWPLTRPTRPTSTTPIEDVERTPFLGRPVSEVLERLEGRMKLRRAKSAR